MQKNYYIFMISSLLARLDEEDYTNALSYISYLYDSRKTADKNRRLMREIQVLHN